jgi:predicted transcriptional regulator
VNAATLKLVGYQHLEHERNLDSTMGKARYTMEEAHNYHEDLAAEEKKLSDIMTWAHNSNPKNKEIEQQQKDLIHVMQEVYARMQENLRDHGPRRPDSFLERLSRKFIK